MQTKDFILLLVIPIVIAGLLLYTNNFNSITAAVVAVDQNNLIGKYSIMPSFKAKTDFDLEKEYSRILELFNPIVESCGKRQDIEQCFSEHFIKLNWECEQTDTDILDDFTDKLKDCLYLEEDNVVCKFSFDERSYINKAEYKRHFTIKLTNDINRIKAELLEKNKVIGIGYSDIENLQYTNFKDKDSQGKNLDEINLDITYTQGMPRIREAAGIAESEKIDLSETFLVYKSQNSIKFVDAIEEKNFQDPSNKIIKLPRTKGLKLCARTGARITAYGADGDVKERDIVYKFAIAFPKEAPKPISGIILSDAKKAENSAVISWPAISQGDVEAYSIYYSKKDFINMKIEDIKADKEIFSLKASVASAEIVEGAPQKLEKGKIYLDTKSNHYFYVVSGIEDGARYNYAVTAVNDEGNEIGNDKSIQGNTFIFEPGKNYGSLASADDLEPLPVSSLEILSQGNGKALLSWIKPVSNVDGSQLTDLNSFHVYYKESSQFETFNILDQNYQKKAISLADANCGALPEINCEYGLDLPQGKYYIFAVAAVDDNLNEALILPTQAKLVI